MSTPTLLQNNEAYVQVDVPFDAAVTTHRVYTAKSPLEPFVFRRSFAPDIPNSLSRDFWNHDEFGFDDHGLTEYYVKITDEIAGIESPLRAAKPVRVPPTNKSGTQIPLLPKPDPVLSTSLSTVFAPSPFFVSLRHFEGFRLLLDATVNSVTIEFIVEVAGSRAGPWYPLALAPAGPIAFDVERAIYSIGAFETGLHALDFGDASSIRFLRISARKTGGGAAANGLGVTVERTQPNHGVGAA